VPDNKQLSRVPMLARENGKGWGFYILHGRCVQLKGRHMGEPQSGKSPTLSLWLAAMNQRFLVVTIRCSHLNLASPGSSIPAG